jgi:hypothetical protein
VPADDLDRGPLFDEVGSVEDPQRGAVRLAAFSSVVTAPWPDVTR